MVEPAFKTLSGRGKIPLLSDGDFVLGESAAITLYLADRFRDQGVFAPEPGTPARALHDELCWFAMTEVDAILYVIRRHDGLPEIYGASEVAVQAAREYTLKSLGEFERRLVDGRSHLLGGEFTVADLLLKTCLDWAAFVYQMPLPDLLVAYSLRVAERPAYAKAMQQNFPPEIMNQLVGDKDA
jgi:glutathione S-transferase